MSITRNLVTASLFAALGTLAPAAIAGEVSTNERGERTVQIDTSDLNLDHADGQKALEQRIRVAVRKVCGTNRSIMPLKEANAIRTCSRKASETALAMANKGQDTQLAVRDTATDPDRR